MISILKAEKPEELTLFKDRLESNGIKCEIIIQNVQTHQFYQTSQAELKIDAYNAYAASNILKQYGNNQQDAVMNIGVEHSQAELILRGELRDLDDVTLLDNYRATYTNNTLKTSEINSIFNEERNYIAHRKAHKFDLNEFLAHLFEGKLFTYLNRNKSTKYEIENELINRLR